MLAAMETKSSSGSASKTHTVSEPDFDRLELAQTTGDGTPPGDFVVVADSPAEGVKLAKDGKVCCALKIKQTMVYHAKIVSLSLSLSTT